MDYLEGAINFDSVSVPRSVPFALQIELVERNIGPAGC